MMTKSLARVAFATAAVFCAGAARRGAQIDGQWSGAREIFGDPPPPYRRSFSNK